MKMTTSDVFVDVATLARPACESQRGDNIRTGSILYRRKTAPAARHGGRLGGRHEDRSHRNCAKHFIGIPCVAYRGTDTP
jgi:hypothetical protein